MRLHWLTFMYSTVTNVGLHSWKTLWLTKSGLYGTLMDRKLWLLFKRNQAHSLSKSDLETVVVTGVITTLCPAIMHLAVQKPPLLSGWTCKTNYHTWQKHIKMEGAAVLHFSTVMYNAIYIKIYFLKSVIHNI